MNKIPLNIEGALLFVPEIFRDNRGINFEGYNDRHFPETRVDSFSHSKFGTLRGFHGDIYNYKIISCLFGVVHFAMIDLRENSKTFEKVYERRLSGSRPELILIPRGLVNAHLCLSDECIFSYKLSDYYVPRNKQISIKWNDSRFKINWPFTPLLTSERDS